MAKSSWSRFYTYVSQDWEGNYFARFQKLVKLDPKMRILLKNKSGDLYENKTRDRTSHAVRKLIEAYVNKYEPIILKQLEDKRSQNIKSVTTEEEGENNEEDPQEEE